MVLMNSSHVSQLNNMLSEHTDIFPNDLVFLLSNQEKNINNLKERVGRGKSNVENDFGVFRIEADYNFEDVNIAVHVELDLLNKAYIIKFAEIKILIRMEILKNNQVGMPNCFVRASVFNKRVRE